MITNAPESCITGHSPVRLQVGRLDPSSLYAGTLARLYYGGIAVSITIRGMKGLGLSQPIPAWAIVGSYFGSSRLPVRFPCLRYISLSRYTKPTEEQLKGAHRNGVLL